MTAGEPPTRPTSAADLIDVTDHPDTDRPAIPAATVLLVRDPIDAAGVEVLMIERGRSTSFGGAWAFPGGVIEVEDVPAGSSRDPLPAARRAAARETAEEVGLLVDPSRMTWWSHWVPPADTPAPKRYSTWFLLAEAGQQHADEHVEVDGREVAAHRWVRPSDAIAAYLDGSVTIVAPTLVTLADLVRRRSVADAMATANPEHYATRIVHVDGGRWCLWHGDAAYDGADLATPGGRNRLLIDADHRRPYERTDWT